ncbi:capsid assembly protein [Pseudomonas phage vB_PsyP_3MF5]|uniref:head assembly n=1 Tax=Pseudomonas phage vB_PsyP_3MF5 TaxID=2749426 RepID=UPI001BDA647E|nr:head assembly [Pseudomonas phage vB_PsyP_3MF5]QLI47585.1 capsid assembly protein [Pseudomonas phage vB_PsyP_3MF5]
MSDIYAEFGVNNAVMTSTDNAEHEQNMLALNVDARDGDDAIHLAEPDESTEGLDQEDQTEGDEEAQEGSDQTEDNGGSEETFELLPEAPDDLKAASAAISAYADGFTALRDQAIKNGLTEEVAARIEAEYEADGISEASYKALEKAGYSRQFVDSYIKGQESIADQFVAKVVDYAGGKDRFDKIIKHMQSTSPESTESLFEAIERQDLKAIRTIINLGVQSHTKKFGKAPARSLTKAAPAAPARRAAPAAEGYSSRAEMIRDMSKSEYRLDPAFRAKVEARVAASSF